MIKKFMGLAIAAFLVTACASSPYESGKSSADVPAHVDVINIKRIFLYGGEADDPLKDSGPHQKPDALEEQDPSDNDLEVLAMAKANIRSQLTNFGYMLTDDEKAPADIRMSFAVSYMPERVMLVHRQVGIRGMVYSPNGTLLYKASALKASAAGVFGSMLQNHDDLVADCAREAVVKIVNEMRKGSLENQPVDKTAKPSAAQNKNSKE